MSNYTELTVSGSDGELMANTIETIIRRKITLEESLSAERQIVLTKLDKIAELEKMIHGKVMDESRLRAQLDKKSEEVDQAKQDIKVEWHARREYLEKQNINTLEELKAAYEMLEQAKQDAKGWEDNADHNWAFVKKERAKVRQKTKLIKQLETTVMILRRENASLKMQK